MTVGSLQSSDLLKEHGSLFAPKGPCRYMLHMVVPKIRGPQYRPQNTIILIMGTPKKVPLILGNPILLEP